MRDFDYYAWSTWVITRDLYISMSVAYTAFHFLKALGISRDWSGLIGVFLMSGVIISRSGSSTSNTGASLLPGLLKPICINAVSRT